MLAPGRVKIRKPFQETYGDVNGISIPVYRIFFTIDGQGAYSVMVPRAGFERQSAIAAVAALAEEIIATEDAFS